MEELQEFCARVLGHGDAAAQAALQAGAVAGGDRVERLSAAAAACRTAEPEHPEAPGQPAAAEPERLAQTVARELAYATAQLPQRQREALVLRELLRLSHEQMASVIGIQPAAAAPLLARARLALRAQLRGAGERVAECPERDRSLASITRRQDAESLSEAEDSWLLEHLGNCAACTAAHAAMLEASVCYRAWQVDAGAIESDPPDRSGQADSALADP
jgi:Sigma-70, region 4